MIQELPDIRNEYMGEALCESTILTHPIKQLELFMERALQCEVNEATAMTLSTVDKAGRPSSRVVLLKDILDGTLVFYTNKDSRKGLDIKQNPNVSVSFFWPELFQQIRIEGIAEDLSDSLSDKYFNSRPRESRIAAIVSPQSKVIPHRQYLDDLYKQIPDNEIFERPKNWGGYRITPCYFEFWQGRVGRLHDRITYTKTGEAWKIQRLAP